MEPSSLETSPTRSVSAIEAPPAADRLQQLLLQLWMTSKATVAERLETIRFAQTRLEQNALDDPTRLQAISAAHKLAGILGTFGLPRGTELAQQVEMALERAGRTGSLDAKALAMTLHELSELVDQKSAEVPSP